MEKKFTSDEVPLDQLLHEAQTGKLQLPDFQRGWVWDDEHITSLLASISLSYPIGAVMTLQTGNPDVRFGPRLLQGVELADAVEPETLLLDGQQRATSLYLALKTRLPVPTRDARRRPMERHYFADVKACIDPEGDREEAIVGVPGDGLVKNFRGEVQLDVSTRSAQLATEMFPLDIILDYSETMSWQLDYLADGPGESEARLKTWMAFNEAVITAFVQYQVPTIQLIKSTPKEAVCQVFEKVNTGGVSLTVFELLTATYAADGFNLREDWEQRRERFKSHDVLGRFDETAFLQLVTLLATHERRQVHMLAHPGDEKVPAVSCKRREMLRLSLEDYERWADVATSAVERVVPFLHSEHVFNAWDLPYPTQIVPLAAIVAVLGEQAEGFGPRQMLARWYWSGVFGEMYGGSTETRFALDLPDVVGWISGEETEPRTVRDAQFQAERLLTLRTRNSAAYKGVYALQMKRGARDFRTGNTIDIHAYVDDAIDIHHIFPQHWCVANAVELELANSIVNKTPIDAHTNRRVGGNAPSTYLATVESQGKVESSTLDEILHSHDIDPVALRQDDFAAFFNKRFERLLKLIEVAMGKPVNRSPDHAENPYADPEREAEALRMQVVALASRGESKVVEFKSTARKNLHTGEKDPQIEWAIIKSVAGFANGSGGTVLVGVADDGRVLGIEEDLPFVRNHDADGWDQWLTSAVASSLGKATAAEIDLEFCPVDGRTVAVIKVGPAAGPVFAKRSKGDPKVVFLARMNSSTQELEGHEALDYQKQRWHA